MSSRKHCRGLGNYCCCRCSNSRGPQDVFSLDFGAIPEDRLLDFDPPPSSLPLAGILQGIPHQTTINTTQLKICRDGCSSPGDPEMATCHHYLSYLQLGEYETRIALSFPRRSFRPICALHPLVRARLHYLLAAVVSGPFLPRTENPLQISRCV